MKKIIYLLIGLCSVLGLQAQNFGSPAMRKLQLAEFAISNLYVDTVNENKLVESAIKKCWHNSTLIPPIRMPKR